MQTHFVDLPSARLRYFENGTQHPGPPVLLLHGGGTDAALLSWKETLPALAQRHRVIAPDWPGYGESTSPSGDFRLRALVDVIHEFLEALDLSRVHLVGISMGGGAALGYALAHPERVAKLVPVDSYGLQTRAPLHEFSFLVAQTPFLSQVTYAAMRSSRALTRAAIRSIYADPSRITDDIVEDVYAIVNRPGANRPFGVFQRDEMGGRRLRTNYLPRLGEITAATLYVHGRQDSLVPLAASREAARLTPNARLHIIDGCGHWPPRERPDEFNRAVGKFLQEAL